MPCTKCGGNHADLLCRAGASQISAYRQRQSAGQVVAAEWLACAAAALRTIEAENIEDNNIINPEDRSDLEVDPKMDALRAELDGLLIVPGAIEGSVAGIQRVAERVLRHKVGNCQEQAYLAFHLMSRLPAVRPLYLIRWGPERGNNHVMVLAGSPDEMGGVFCDPWARLSGLARDYRAVFMGKLAMWQGLGLKIAGARDTFLNPSEFAAEVLRGSPTVLFRLEE